MTAPPASPRRLADIAASLPGYDPQDLPVDVAAAFLAQWVEPVAQADTVALRDALGRIVARDVVSPVDVPPHDNAAMDGYAFDGAALQQGAPLLLTVAGQALAGRAWGGTATAGECVAITTGAVLPPGLDTVVPQELAVLGANGRVQVPAGAVRRGEHCRPRGEDLQRDATALTRGERIGPAALGLLASLGLPSVAVARRVRVAYFSTGDEVLAPGDAPRDGAIYDSNRLAITGLLARLGVDVVEFDTVRDEPAALAAAFTAAAATADAIVTTGGVSAGAADHTRATMARLGDVAFWRLAMRPGRPMAVGRIATPGGAGALLFGLPGNPVAAMVAFIALVRPALLRLMGAGPRALAPAPLARARSTVAIRKRPGRTEYQRGVLSAGANGMLDVTPVGHQGSGVLSSMVRADVLIVLAHHCADVAAGDAVAILFFEGSV